MNSHNNTHGNHENHTKSHIKAMSVPTHAAHSQGTDIGICMHFMQKHAHNATIQHVNGAIDRDMKTRTSIGTQTRYACHGCEHDTDLQHKQQTHASQTARACMKHKSQAQNKMLRNTALDKTSHVAMQTRDIFFKMSLL